MVKTLLSKLGFSLFSGLSLECLAAKVLTAAIQRMMASKRTAGQVAQIRKTVLHLTELIQLIDPMLEDHAVTGDEARQMAEAANQTRLKVLALWADGKSAKELETQLPE
ncbi:MAG: hypothetical protein AB7E95_06755 [Kiritimatiellales bacterium]